MDIFQALGDKSRRSIIELLARKGTLSSTEISNQFHISAPAISQHLKVLKEANLVQMEKRAQQRLYKINPDAMEDIKKWIKKLTEMWDDRFATLDRILEKQKRGGGKG